MFKFPSCILWAPPRNGKKHLNQHDNQVLKRLNRLLAGERTELWAEAASSCAKVRNYRPPTDNSANPEQQAKNNISRAQRFGHQGNYRKAMASLTSAGLASDSATLSTLRDKHPSAPLPTVNTQDTQPAMQIDAEVAMNCLRNFPRDSAAGLSHTYVTHYLNAIECPTPEYGARAAAAFTDVINVLAAGQAPVEVAPYLCGAPLYALKKKCGGIRPIAVGETLRRWTAKCLCSVITPKVVGQLKPLQLGTGVRGGCEAITQAINCILEQDTDTPYAILCVDLQNAFNSVSRDEVLKQVSVVCPELSAWVEYCYSRPSYLSFAGNFISSECGVQQGDPLSPLLFALAIQPVILKIKSEVPDLMLNAWYLDDGTFVGEPHDLAHALDILEIEFPLIGLQVNEHKCEVWAPNPSNTDLSVVNMNVSRCEEGMVILGTPISLSDDFIDKAVAKRAEKATTVLKLLPDINDPQLELALLRVCGGVPKMSFSLSTCKPTACLL